MKQETEQKENNFLQELNQLMKKYKIESIMTGEQGALYYDDNEDACLAGEVYIQFKNS